MKTTPQLTVFMWKKTKYKRSLLPSNKPSGGSVGTTCSQTLWFVFLRAFHLEIGSVSVNWTLVRCSRRVKWFSRLNEREKIEKWFEKGGKYLTFMWISLSSAAALRSVFVVCKAYLTFDNKFKVQCLVEVTQDYFSSLIWSSRFSLPQFSPGLARSPALLVIHRHLDQRQTRKIKQINSDALDNIPLWLTRPLRHSGLGRDPAVPSALGIRGASVCWFGLHVLTCR